MQSKARSPAHPGNERDAAYASRRVVEEFLRCVCLITGKGSSGFAKSFAVRSELYRHPHRIRMAKPLLSHNGREVGWYVTDRLSIISAINLA